MPYRLQSCVSERELHPIFQINLPEGALRETIRNAFAKLRLVDDIALLRITGKRTYERVVRTIRDLVSPENPPAASEQFFATLVLSVMVRNGDAHLKSFGLLYRYPLAPVYDIGLSYLLPVHFPHNYASSLELLSFFLSASPR